MNKFLTQKHTSFCRKKLYLFATGLALLLVLCDFAQAQPLTHRFKAALEESGAFDGFTVYHAGIGVIKTIANETFWAFNLRYNWFDEPVYYKQALANLSLALLWEVGEFVIESPELTWESYNDFYNGHAFINNATDVVIDQLCFMIPGYVEMYYDIRLRFHGKKIFIEVSF